MKDFYNLLSDGHYVAETFKIVFLRKYCSVADSAKLNARQQLLYVVSQKINLSSLYYLYGVSRYIKKI